ncbi:MAG: sugar phosphate nucleotidyltransferase, partial [Anaerovoracaceae bacterium]
MKPKLVVMAAGLGSRYGGLKQMENMTSEGEIILDFGCYDAVKAGFEEIVFVIKPEMEEIFRERVLKRMSRYVKCSYVFQMMEQLPAGYEIPVGREKPWGTCHAVMAAAPLLAGPFAVINSDDYYGADAFQKVFDFLSSDTDENTYCMAGYYVENTLSETGTVTRGVCQVDVQGNLLGIDEPQKIGWIDEVGGEIGVLDGSGRMIPKGTPVSMNFWGFKSSMLDYMKAGFPKFLDRTIR